MAHQEPNVGADTIRPPKRFPLDGTHRRYSAKRKRRQRRAGIRRIRAGWSRLRIAHWRDCYGKLSPKVTDEVKPLPARPQATDHRRGERRLSGCHPRRCRGAEHKGGMRGRSCPACWRGRAESNRLLPVFTRGLPPPPGRPEFTTRISGGNPRPRFTP